MAMAVYQALAPLAEQQQRRLYVSLLPNARSPFKDQTSEPSHRLAMLERATADSPLEVCTLELWQSPPVYSIDTVQSLRQQYPNDSLIFIMGADSAASLNRWKAGLHLTDYVHLWVFNRHSDSQQGNTADPTTNIAELLPKSLQSQITVTLTDLLGPVNAHIHPIIVPPQAAASAPPSDALKWVDQRVKQEQYSSLDLKPCAIGRIYSDDTEIMAVSSSQLRHLLCSLNDRSPDNQRLAETEIIRQALPTAVYDYIRQHHLYCRSDFAKIND